MTKILASIRAVALLGFISLCGLYATTSCAYAQFDPVCGYMTCDAGSCGPCHIQLHRCGDTALCFDCDQVCAALTSAEVKAKMILRAAERQVNPSSLTDVGVLQRSQIRASLLHPLTTHQDGLPPGHPLVNRERALQVDLARIVPPSPTARKCAGKTMFKIDPAKYGLGI